jgi:hypothetical protein
MGEAPKSTPPRLFHAWHVALATAIGGPIGGGVALTLNERRLGRSRLRAGAIVAASVFFTYAMIVARWATESAWWIPLYGLTVACGWGAAILLHGATVKSHAQAGGQFESWPASLLFGALGWPATIVAGGVVVLAMVLAPNDTGARLWYEWKLLRPQKVLGRCDMRGLHPTAAQLGGGSDNGVVRDDQVCLEFTGDRSWSTRTSVENARSICHYAWSEAPCERGGVLGGCRFGVGITFWYYASSAIQTEGDVERTCAEREQEFVRR